MFSRFFVRRALTLAALAPLAVVPLPAHAQPVAMPAPPAAARDIPPARIARLAELPEGVADAGAVRAFRAMRTPQRRLPFAIRDTVVHAGRGFYMVGAASNTYGAYANETLYPALREAGTPTTSDFLYAPTMFGPGADCIEAVTVVANVKAQIWAWDWCAASPGPFRVIEAGKTFASRYVRTMPDGLPEYTVETVLAADGQTWDMLLYDYTARAWKVVYQTSGARNASYGLGASGWNFFETYTSIDRKTNTSDVCRSFGGLPIAADGIEIATGIAGSAFTPLVPANAQPLAFANFHCSHFAFSVPSADDFWEMNYR